MKASGWRDCWTVEAVVLDPTSRLVNRKAKQRKKAPDRRPEDGACAAGTRPSGMSVETGDRPTGTLRTMETGFSARLRRDTRKSGTPMIEAFYEQPILNSPYVEPSRHHALDEDCQPTDEPLIPGRGRSELITPITKHRKHCIRDVSKQTAMGN